jgi:hypothetical protein
VPRKVRSRPSLIGLGGWLFADLLLVLSVVWLGTQSYFDPSTFEINPVTANQKPRVLDPKPDIFDVSLNAAEVRAGDATALDELRQKLSSDGMSRLEKSERVAGIIMTFSGSDRCGQVGVAQSTSTAVNKYLEKWYPSFVVKQSVKKAYIDYSCNRANHLKLEIYSFAN